MKECKIDTHMELELYRKPVINFQGPKPGDKQENCIFSRLSLSKLKVPYLLHDYQITLLAPTNHPRIECEKNQVNNTFESILDEDAPYSNVVKNITSEETRDMFKAFEMDFFVFLYIIYSICSIRKSLKQHFFTNSEAATGGGV